MRKLQFSGNLLHLGNNLRGGIESLMNDRRPESNARLDRRPAGDESNAADKIDRLFRYKRKANSKRNTLSIPLQWSQLSRTYYIKFCPHNEIVKAWREDWC